MQFLGVSGIAGGLAGCTGLTGTDGGGSDGNDSEPLDEESQALIEDATVDDPAGDPVDTIKYENLDPDFAVRYWYAQEHADILSDIGFDVEFNARAVPAHLELLFDTREFDVVPMRWLDGVDPDRVLNDGFSKSTLTEGGGNTPGHESEWYEEKLTEQRQLTDPDERQEVVYEMQQYLMEEQVVTPIIAQQRVFPYDSNRLSNVRPTLENSLASVWNVTSMEVTEGDGVVTTTQSEELSNINPVSGLAARATRDQVRRVYDRLMYPDPDEGYRPSPWAAESVNWIDETTIEITLREGMSWHDGEDVTAEDVKFTFDYLSEHNATFGSLAENLDSITIEDETSLVIDLSQPDATFEARVLAGRFSYLLPKHLWEDVSNPGEDMPEPVGSGPFQVDDFSRGEQLQLSSFDDHHHAPNVDGINRVQASDDPSAANMMRGGSVDIIMYDISPDLLNSLREESGIEMASALMTSIHYMVWNQRNEPFNDRRVRRALAHTIPRQDVVNIGADGNAEIIHASFSKGLEFWYNPDVPKFNYNPDKARLKLAEAGFQWEAESGRIHYPEDWSPVENTSPTG